MPIDEQATWLPSPFHWNGREGYAPRFLVIHGTAGGDSADGVAHWFQDEEAHVSTNYEVDEDGKEDCSVDENNAAWGNGALSEGHDAFWDTVSCNPNLVSISLEHVKPNADNSNLITPAQQQTSFALIKRICQRWNIPMRPADQHGGICSHASLDPVNRSDCPGPFPWDELWTFLGHTPQQQTQGDTMQLSLGSPEVAKYFIDGGGGKLKRKDNGLMMGSGISTYYLANGGPGVLRLNTTNELQVRDNAGHIIEDVAYVITEACIIIYDPKRKVDNPPTKEPCYLMHIDSGPGQQLVAQALVKPLQAEIAQLKKSDDTTQLTEANAQLTTENAQYKAKLGKIAEIART